MPTIKIKMFCSIGSRVINKDLVTFQDLVRTRRYVKKFMLMRANIQAVSLKIQTLKSQNAMAQVLINRRAWIFAIVLIVLFTL